MGIPDPDYLAERVSAQLLSEWRAFESYYGPILVQERVDWGLATLTTVMSGGGSITDHLPPWQLSFMGTPESIEDANERQMLQTMLSLKEKFGKGG